MWVASGCLAPGPWCWDDESRGRGLLACVPMGVGWGWGFSLQAGNALTETLCSSQSWLHRRGRLLNQKVFSKIMYRKLKMYMIWRHLGRGGLC